jgi:hypothetical protein
VFRDEVLGVWGYLDAYNEDNSAKPLTTEPVDTVYELVKNPEGEVTEIGFLPAGDGTRSSPRGQGPPGVLR